MGTHAEEPMNHASLLLAAIAIAAGISAVHANLDPSWQDTEMTTRLYHLITKNENQELQTVLDEDNSRAALRAADGRGPLFWAHEANNDEAIEMLKKAGASEDWQDADGKTCTNFEHGQMTEYMRKLNEAREKEWAEQRARMDAQEVEIDEDDDDDDDDEDDADDEEDDE